MKSMTGYGKSAYFSEEFDVSVEIKSVNNRFLDLKLSCPRELSFLEPQIKKEVNNYIKRGKADLRITVNDKRPPELELNKTRLLAFKEIYSKINEILGSENNIPLETVLRESGIVAVKQSGSDNEEYSDAVIETLVEALKEHEKMAINEGKSMQDFLASSLDIMFESLVNIEKEFPAYKKELFLKFKEQITELLNEVSDPVTEKRILAETAFYIEKSDVNEEIVRFRNHINKFREKLYLEGEETGKSLNFILQEMHREVNTVGSKFNFSEVFSDVLRIKEEIEKCREMVQNVE
ncbi:MAG: YicC family protein [Candidatus Cloacimonadota bacterium]|nr:MAG: YicC family protein [Candidatus Cloacimonadota bacterium]